MVGERWGRERGIRWKERAPTVFFFFSFFFLISSDRRRAMVSGMWHDYMSGYSLHIKGGGGKSAELRPLGVRGLYRPCCFTD